MTRRLPVLELALSLMAGVAPASAQVRPPSANLLRATAAVPVFVPVNPGGNLLLGTPPGGGAPVAMFFLRRGLAERFVAGVRSGGGALGAQLKVEVSSLADLFRAQPATRTYEITFIPDSAEVEQAVAELKLQGKAGAIPGVPAFLLRSPTAGYVTITVNGRTVIPAFLSHDGVLALRTQLLRTPGVGTTAGSPVIEVTTLEALLGGLESSADPIYESILVEPSPAALAEARPAAGPP